MQNLGASVGQNGANARHDVSLVQALLVLGRRPATLDPAQPSYLTRIDGDYGPKSQAALRQFQSDRVFVSPDGKASQPLAGATPGFVAPGDPTWVRLVACAPAAFAELRVLAGGKTVYVAAPGERLAAVATRLQRLTFEPAFRARLVMLVQRIHARHGIAIDVCPDGDRRTFQTQYDLLTSGRNVTHAGPGESNHNFGQAADLGFQGLRWLREDGTAVENETAWLHRLESAPHGQAESLRFWELLRSEGAPLGLHRGPLADRPHLQAWSDSGLDMADRLADLLTRSGRMRWTGSRQRYKSDLGLGGVFFDVGSAEQIWSGQAAITPAALAQARAQARSRQPQLAPVASGAMPRAAAAVPAAQEVAELRAALRADFEAADAAWQSWRPR